MNWRQPLILIVILGLTAAAGVGFSQALKPEAFKTFKACHPARALAPREFVAAPPICINRSKTYKVTLDTTVGAIVLDLDPKTAPITVNNFVVLALSDYFNGVNFWNKTSWMVQSGDPRGDGRGGPGYYLPDEPSTTDWPAGSVGMARIPGHGVSGSQFFLTTGSWPGNGPGNTAYNFFGTVDSGSQGLVTDLTPTDRILDVTVKTA